MTVWDIRAIWIQRSLKVCDIPPIPIQQKIFKPKFLLPRLDSYQIAAPDWYWQLFPKNYNSPATSLINPDRVRELAELCQYPDTENLEVIVNNIRNGADIGCKGKFRKASRARNAMSSFEVK